MSLYYQLFEQVVSEQLGRSGFSCAHRATDAGMG